MPPDKHNEILINVAAIIIVFIAISSLLIFILLFYQRKRFAHKEKLVNLKKEFTEELFKSRLETQEQTLQQLSTELHDNLGALASLIKINLITIANDDADKAAQKIEDTTALTRQLIADIKSLSVSLSSDRIIRKGFFSSLATEVERINKTGLFTATLSLNEKLPEPDSDKATILYRMVQEILNNAIKHSSARNIDITVLYKKPRLSIKIADDGTGFNIKEKQEESEGAGLYNLQKRALMIGASFSVNSGPGEGTCYIIELVC